MAQVYTRLNPSFENIFFERQSQGDENTPSKITLNFGPQHPSAHGQLRLILELENEIVTKATPDIGYLHRGVEKLAENMIYNEFMPTTDRLDYISSVSNNFAYALSVERLIGVEVPLRAEAIRVILLELSRIISHIFYVGVHGMDVGALSIFLYAFKQREYGLDLMEEYCGARLTHNAMRIGGVPLDLPTNFENKVHSFLDSLPEMLGLIEGLLNKNRIWKTRLEGVGVISKELVKSWALSGIIARGCGLKVDIRRSEPYSIYEKFDFDIPLAKEGDCYARYRLYMEEIRQSAKIIRQALQFYKDTPPQIMARDARYISPTKEEIMTQNYSLMEHFVLVTQGMRPPVGESYVPTESPRGELGFIIHSLGAPYPYRLKVRAPCFYHTGLLQDLLVGHYLADVVTIIGNLNAIFGEVDR